MTKTELSGLKNKYEPPESQEYSDSIGSESNRAVSIVIDMRGEEFRKRYAYPVIVEMWDKKGFGRVQRAWLKEFTAAERKKIASWHTKFRKWHLQTGTPARVHMTGDTFELLQRALNFFGTI